MLHVQFNKYGFGVPLSLEYDFNPNKVKKEVETYLIGFFNDSFKDATFLDLPDEYENYVWVPWREYNPEISFNKIQFRRDLYTPYTMTSRDIEFYDGDEELLSYHDSYFRTFPIKYILKMCKKHIGGFLNKRCLVLGCGTGECLLMLEAYGIKAHGYELSKYAYENANNLAFPNITFGDFIADLSIIEDKKYDFVFTNLLNWIDRKDINPILIEINRISTMFITQYLYDGNCYKLKSKKWWQKQFKKAGMTIFPTSNRVALCL